MNEIRSKLKPHAIFSTCWTFRRHVQSIFTVLKQCQLHHCDARNSFYSHFRFSFIVLIVENWLEPTPYTTHSIISDINTRSEHWTHTKGWAAERSCDQKLALMSNSTTQTICLRTNCTITIIWDETFKEANFKLPISGDYFSEVSSRTRSSFVWIKW